MPSDKPDNRLRESARRLVRSTSNPFATTAPGMVPPNSAELEAAVLGSMMLEKDAINTCLAMLRGNVEIFYQPAHQHVFSAIISLNEQGRAIDTMTVVEQLRKVALLEKAGGVGAVAGLTMKINSAAHLVTHCLLLIEFYTRRRIATVGRLFLAEGHNDTTDPLELLAEAQKHLNSLHDTLQIRQARTVGQMMDETFAEIRKAVGTAGGITGVPTGLAAVDNVSGGWQPGELIILAARPGMGKTSFILHCAKYAQRVGKTGMLFSLEMGWLALMKKIVASESGYSTAKLGRGLDMTMEEVDEIERRMADLRTSGLILDDTASISIGELRAKVAKAVAEQGVQIVYVDYLQLMSGDAKSGNREQEIGTISRGLKLISKENNIPVIALSQLSRAVETRGGDKKPQLSDLRESGSIEQDADVVIFLYRAEYYKIMEDDMGNPTADTTEVIFAKQRNGGLKSPIVQSIMRTGTYRDLPEDAPYEVRDYTSPTRSFGSTDLPQSDFDNEGPHPPYAPDF